MSFSSGSESVRNCASLDRNSHSRGLKGTEYRQNYVSSCPFTEVHFQSGPKHNFGSLNAQRSTTLKSVAPGNGDWVITDSGICFGDWDSSTEGNMASVSVSPAHIVRRPQAVFKSTHLSEKQYKQSPRSDRGLRKTTDLNSEENTRAHKPVRSRPVFRSHSFNPRDTVAGWNRMTDSPPPVPPRTRRSRRAASSRHRWPSDSDIMLNNYSKTREIPSTNPMTSSQTATIRIRGDPQIPEWHQDPQALQAHANTLPQTQEQPGFANSAQPTGESAEFSKWDGALRTNGPTRSPQATRPSYTRTFHGGLTQESPKNYQRLSNVTSVVPLSGLSPFSGGFSRDSVGLPGRESIRHQQPGFPSSGESVISRRSTFNGATLSFHHIRYEVKTKKMPWSRAVTKTVLDDVSGILRPGVNAIMGPTGSGKSSLLDVLAGRKDPRFLSGQVLVDGAPQPKNFKCISGYVVQDDIVMGTLTVRENLHFSAALRMTVKCSKAERDQKVNEIIDELGLTAVADSKVR
ncbi:unnamed protein product [Echinostoma caproni]|uniref:ABC transporter domain-containing protein n=1 Tax=Echinostoma caproni TaxID=27848 RepID=A0A183AMB1_9TREM|nr:unnamed protein product [Echinostoma caproni]